MYTTEAKRTKQKIAETLCTCFFQKVVLEDIECFKRKVFLAPRSLNADEVFTLLAHASEGTYSTDSAVTANGKVPRAAVYLLIITSLPERDDTLSDH
ncbi:hypothetical protein M514_09518 [Trichuris suis]|uniref:Uncharacterized protein n=1 Tax=Trichuris suis TaxID=68888 RepID=A0A085LX79_9BILA|nr:hypothetical protein M513_09518 [Trichuris suis]KFD70136.1 hypothetical protein M514_09518 [Trichuris suis]